MVVENNWSGQMSGLLAKELQVGDKIETIRKFDGNPFTKADVMKQYQQLTKEVV